MSKQKPLRHTGTAACALLLGIFIAPGIGLIRAQTLRASFPEESASGLIRILEVVSVKAEPDTAYLLMAVETERGQLAEAFRENEKQMQAFITALHQMGIPAGALSIKNLVVTPAIMGKGFSLTRNLVITETEINRRPAGELARRLAQVHDVGARFGSSCITCIGSG
jgi:hypothetical protein